MRRRSPVPLEFLVLCAAAGAGCITINLYFPAAELRDAASEIVTDIRSPESASPGAEDAPASSGGAEGAAAGEEPEAGPGDRAAAPEAPEEEVLRPPAPARPPRRGLLAFLETRAAHAAAPDEGGKGIKLDISSPVIKRIREALKKRYLKLVPFFERGALGEGLDGYVALRETGGFSLKERRDLQALLEEENKDRKNLYTEIARENAIDPSRVPDIGLVFSREWQKTSKTGWWIEKEKGKWIRKPEEKKKKP